MCQPKGSFSFNGPGKFVDFYMDAVKAINTPITDDKPTEAMFHPVYVNVHSTDGDVWVANLNQDRMARPTEIDLFPAYCFACQDFNSTFTILEETFGLNAYVPSLRQHIFTPDEARDLVSAAEYARSRLSRDKNSKAIEQMFLRDNQFFRGIREGLEDNDYDDGWATSLDRLVVITKFWLSMDDYFGDLSITNPQLVATKW